MSFQQENQGQVVSLKQYLKIFPYICQKQLERKVYEAQHCQAQSVTLQHERLEERSCWSRTQGISWHLFFTKDPAVLEFRLTKSWRKKKKNRQRLLKIVPNPIFRNKEWTDAKNPICPFQEKSQTWFSAFLNSHLDDIAYFLKGTGKV